MSERLFDGDTGELSEILELAGRQPNGVPKGLARCPLCRDWIGRCLWPDPLKWHLGPTRVSCRCEANLCDFCGEPRYEYRLGSNIYDEASQEVVHVPGLAGYTHRCGMPRIQLPIPIEPEWDEKYAPVMAGFPVQLVYIGVRPRKDETGKPIAVKSRYSFDPGSFIQDDARKQMRYLPLISSEFYVDIIWETRNDRWTTFKYEGNRLVCEASGDNFDEAMRKTLAAGLELNEPAA